MSTSTQLRQDAESKFKRKELQRLDGCAAMAEYEAKRAEYEQANARAGALYHGERAYPVYPDQRY